MCALKMRGNGRPLYRKINVDKALDWRRLINEWEEDLINEQEIKYVWVETLVKLN